MIGHSYGKREFQEALEGDTQDPNRLDDRVCPVAHDDVRNAGDGFVD
jgi:hypothetical protein